MRPGVECQEIDHAARRVIADAGHGEHFIHRTDELSMNHRSEQRRSPAWFGGGAGTAAAGPLAPVTGRNKPLVGNGCVPDTSRP